VALKAYFALWTGIAPPPAESAKAPGTEGIGPGPLGKRTIFLAGDPEEFAGLATRVRTIVLNEADLDAASQKFGRMLVTHLSPIVIDQTGTREWVQIDDEWRGATYLLMKSDGKWIALLVGPWVT
jgi:hypothetical protein